MEMIVLLVFGSLGISLFTLGYRIGKYSVESTITREWYHYKWQAFFKWSKEQSKTSNKSVADFVLNQVSRELEYQRSLRNLMSQSCKCDARLVNSHFIELDNKLYKLGYFNLINK